MGADIRTDDLPVQIGERVRALRDAQGLSGRKLAAAAGVSQPFLSQLESGQTSVAIATLYRLAFALGVGPSDLLPPPTQSGIEILGAPQIRHMAISDQADAAEATAVFRAGHRITELLDYTIEPGQYIEEWFETGGSGEYLTYVIDGSIRVEVGDQPDVVLETGDVMFYESSVRSRWHLEGDVRARILLVGTGP